MAISKNPDGFDYQEFLTECKGELKSTFARFKKINFANLMEAGPLAYALVQALVAKVEEKATQIGGLPGEVKKQVVTDLIAGQVQIAKMTDEQERAIISHLIEAVVPILNIVLSKKWPQGIFALVAKVVGWIKKIF